MMYYVSLYQDKIEGRICVNQGGYSNYLDGAMAKSWRVLAENPDCKVRVEKIYEVGSDL
tara:strand:- start:413 stop:589 length:177 start_codon:yes stop_codon:yes gene_type:complete